MTEPKAALTTQATALLGTEGFYVSFTPDGIQRLAEIAYQVNESTENIGARRLHTVMERLLEEASYDAPNQAGQTLEVNATFVDERLGALAKDQDLSQYIL